MQLCDQTVFLPDASGLGFRRLSVQCYLTLQSDTTEVQCYVTNPAATYTMLYSRSFKVIIITRHIMAFSTRFALTDVYRVATNLLYPGKAENLIY